ncbi:MAG: phosphoribosylformylglycinamidine synthase [Candidatus Doudnabacteria bacterium]|nr:phosphoribosylformylglycinamidine synthase [Candidatus Doudnabacteria bacterium]
MQLSKLFRRLGDRASIGRLIAAARIPGIDESSLQEIEVCYNIGHDKPIEGDHALSLGWILRETFEAWNLRSLTNFQGFSDLRILEIGPRLNFETAWSSTAVAICAACGLPEVKRLEASLRYLFDQPLSSSQREGLASVLADRMTEMVYESPLTSFDHHIHPAPVRYVRLLEEGIDALCAINAELGLSMDKADLIFVYELFITLGRNPTDVELFQIGQANSEHCRHGFWKGLYVVNGRPLPHSLMHIVKAPWVHHPSNSIIAFCDDSSAIMGGQVEVLLPTSPGRSSAFNLSTVVLHPTLTAETHNHPTRIAPYPGAATGVGGRIRDNQVVGRGGLVGVGGLMYCVGQLNIPGYSIPGEIDHGYRDTPNLPTPLDVLIEGSNGASHYANCFGEAGVIGSLRTYELRVGDKDLRSYRKPILYTCGLGQMVDEHISKGSPEAEMLVVQLGGPAYRIGVGGGAASSMTHGENTVELDFNSVQRGNPEMENRVNRVIRACCELLDRNPIISAHDLGAGGDANALPEIVDPAGAKIQLRAIPLGDSSLSVLEYLGNESQERNAFLIHSESFGLLEEISRREGAPCVCVGEVTGDGLFIVHDSADNSTPVNLPLKELFGNPPRKTFEFEDIPLDLTPLVLPSDLTFESALDGVLRQPAVGSKRFLTTKLDRSVGGLVAQQQCVGPNHLPLSDYAVMAQSHFDTVGTAMSLGERPTIGLINPAAMARMSVAEMLLNMAGACITDIEHIKCSVNWMWAAKEPGEGVRLYQAAEAMSDIMMTLGIAGDGGKDSSSMAAKMTAPDGTSEKSKAPGTLVIAGYATMADVTAKVTPEFKGALNGVLLVELGDACRLGGSALAQSLGQLGDEAPDVTSAKDLKFLFQCVQDMIGEGLITAVHDRSDGGLITALLEMSFASNFGFIGHFKTAHDPIEAWFNEEVGLLIETPDPNTVSYWFRQAGLKVHYVATTVDTNEVTIYHNSIPVLNNTMTALRAVWEETSFQLDALQANPECVAAEREAVRSLLSDPPRRLTFDPDRSAVIVSLRPRPKVAVLRAPGTNGDREMVAVLYMVGFEVYDLTMSDLLEGYSLEDFSGLVFPGGFSFGDVLDAGKGWAGMVKFNDHVRDQFDRFYARLDTFSLGVCNGCQFMALLGRVPGADLPDSSQPRFIANKSGRFESRFSTVEILPSPSIFLQGMEGSRLGVWVAHGEGRLYVPQPEVLQGIIQGYLAPIRYLDHDGDITCDYPFNPNGSPQGIAALCSADGRHLAMMPHPERCFLPWQSPWSPYDWRSHENGPWLRMFRNAFAWCQT